MTAFKLILLGFLALLGALPSAAALPAGPTVRVVEYYDSATRRFFMTADPAEQAAFDAGGYASTRGRTGLEFDALAADVETCETRASGQVVCAGSIVRFDYAAFDWFFYSPKPSEWAQLKAPNSGFIDRGVAFKAFLPDGPGGTCTQGRVAVFRSYRNQNHRFPPDAATHQRMVATGSENEGITFCAESAKTNPIVEARFLARPGPAGGTVTEDQCPLRNVEGDCLIRRNLQPPSFFEEFAPGQVPQAYIDRTGFNGRFIFSQGDASLIDRSFGSLVQFQDPGELGLHVNTGNRNNGPGPSAFDLVHNFEAYTLPGARDRRLIPFRRIYDVPVELSMRFLLFVKAVDLSSGSLATGKLRLVLLDVAEDRIEVIGSERRIDFVVQIYGDTFAKPDSVTREGVTFTSLGQAVVTTSVDSTTFGRQATNLPYLQTPPGFRASNFWGYGGAYDYRIDLAALQRIVDAVRATDPAYSPDARQYQVLAYRVENQVEGSGRLGLNVRDVTLQLLRR